MQLKCPLTPCFMRKVTAVECACGFCAWFHPFGPPCLGVNNATWRGRAKCGSKKCIGTRTCCTLSSCFNGTQLENEGLQMYFLRNLLIIDQWYLMGTALHTTDTVANSDNFLDLEVTNNNVCSIKLIFV